MWNVLWADKLQLPKREHALTPDSMARAEEGLGREGVCVDQAPHWEEASEPHTGKPDLHTRSHAVGEARLPHKVQPQLGFPGRGPEATAVAE